MKTELRKVYECDHCGKRMLSAGAMTRHEKGCSQNPNNWHKCFKMCVHLQKTIERIKEPMRTEDDDMPLDITRFHCALTGKEMYSYKFEKAKGFKPVYLNGLQRMPLSCELYVAEEGYRDPFQS